MMKITLMTSFSASVTPDWHSPIADEMAARWVEPGADVRGWRSSANHVFRVCSAQGNAFLRFNHVSERSAGDYESELAFVEYLARHGLHVARPVVSKAGKRVEQVDTPLGAMNAVLSVGYSGPSRLSWRDHLAYARRFVPAHETAAWHELDAVRRALAQLPTSRDTYGLIHYDFEQDNLVWRDGHVGALDFDDCACYWYAADVAYALREVFADSYARIDLAHPSVCAFVRGYREAKPLADDELRWLRLHFRLHQLYAFARVTRSIADELSPAAPAWAYDLRVKLMKRLDMQRDEFAAHPYG
jgi:Ser/Thr protein kinase RdoA (MazF antagonist)